VVDGIHFGLEEILEFCAEVSGTRVVGGVERAEQTVDGGE